ncbi:MAG TPA: hypothetical protein VLC09_14620 [Polyangiaceae bacterium]|nr:hypothetical protein [Polyangiaceae bacterium]
MLRSALPWLGAALLGAAVTLVAGRSLQLGPPEARAATPAPPEWSYYCMEVQNAAQLNEKANRAAARGWELFAGSPGSSGAIWCLRRPGPSPLRELPTE